MNLDGIPKQIDELKLFVPHSRKYCLSNPCGRTEILEKTVRKQRFDFSDGKTLIRTFCRTFCRSICRTILELKRRVTVRRSDDLTLSVL